MRVITICTVLLLLTVSISPASERKAVRASYQGDSSQVSLTTSYIPHDPIVIRSNAEFASQQWSGSGTENDPYLIENLNVSAYGTCIKISNTDAHFIVRNCFLTTAPSYPWAGNKNGIYFKNVTWASIVDSIIDRKHFAVEIENSSRCEVMGCIITSSTWLGVRIENSTWCNVTHNLVRDSRYSGIWINDSMSCTVRGNKVFDSHYSVIAGGELTDLIVTNCMLFRNDIGIRLTAHKCVVVNNTVYANSEWGIAAYKKSGLNRFYRNRVGWNGVENAVDDGTSNSWDDGVLVGNAWSDYDGDGMYQISGTSGSTDRYPSVLEDLIPPSIDHPDDIQYINGTTGMSIEWSPSDQYPAFYEVLINGIVNESATWDGSKIRIHVSGLTPGVYNYTLRVFDGAGNMSEDSVLVEVVLAWSWSDYSIVLFLLALVSIAAIVFRRFCASHSVATETEEQNLSESSEDLSEKVRVPFWHILLSRVRKKYVSHKSSENENDMEESS